MLSTKLTQAVVNSACHKQLGSLPVVCSRALYATKPVDDADKSTWQRAKEAICDKVSSVTGSGQKATPSGESGRDVRDIGTQKVNVPLGQHSKKADSPGQSTRGHDDVSAGKTSASFQQQGGVNYQQKRNFIIRPVLAAKDFDAQRSAGQSGDKDSFVAPSSKQNVNPQSSQSQQSWLNNVQNLDFWPPPPGPAVFMRNHPSITQNQGQNNQGQIKASRESSTSQASHSHKPSTYSTHTHNPSKTGKDQEGKYFDEAMAGKSGPLVEENDGKQSKQQPQHSSWDGKGDSKPPGNQTRKFSSSASLASRMGGAHEALQNTDHGTKSNNSETNKSFSPPSDKAYPDSASGINPTERQRTGSPSVKQGPVEDGASAPSRRGMATHANMPDNREKSKNPGSACPSQGQSKAAGNIKAESVGGAESGGILDDDVHKGKRPPVAGKTGGDTCENADSNVSTFTKLKDIAQTFLGKK